MLIHLTAEQNDLVRLAVESGRIRDDVQAVQEALALWMERERMIAELKQSLDVAEASLASGEGIEITENGMRSLAADVMTRATERQATTEHERRQATTEHERS